MVVFFFILSFLVDLSTQVFIVKCLYNFSMWNNCKVLPIRPTRERPQSNDSTDMQITLKPFIITIIVCVAVEKSKLFKCLALKKKEMNIRKYTNKITKKWSRMRKGGWAKSKQKHNISQKKWSWYFMRFFFIVFWF